MGVPTKKTPYEVSEASDVVITMLPSSAHVSIVIPVAFPFAANTSHRLWLQFPLYSSAATTYSLNHDFNFRLTIAKMI